MTAFQQGQWQSSIQKLEAFASDNCPTTPSTRCEEARITTAQSYLRLGQVRNAYLILENARWDKPQTRELTERIDHLEGMAHDAIVTQLRHDPGNGSAGVTFSSQTHGRMRFRKLTLAMDFNLLHGQDGHADDTTASIVIPALTMSAGEHLLDVLVVYEGAGSISPGYRFTAVAEQTFMIPAGHLLDIRVQVTERPDWSEWHDALEITFYCRQSPNRIWAIGAGLEGTG